MQKFGAFFCVLAYPISIRATISPALNVTGGIAAPRAQVWPLVRDLDSWNTFTRAFSPELVGGRSVVEVGQDILFTTDFGIFSSQTIDRIYDIVENERICWSLRAILVGQWEVVLPSKVLRTNGRCIELFDGSSGETETIINNWITYDGILWPMIVLFTGAQLEKLFEEFNNDLAGKFLSYK